MLESLWEGFCYMKLLLLLVFFLQPMGITHSGFTWVNR